MEDNIQFPQEMLDLMAEVSRQQNAQFRLCKTLLVGFKATGETDINYMDAYMDSLYDFMELHTTIFRYSPRLPPRFLPPREVFIHQRMEPDIMAGFKQMAQFMNHHMLHAPFRQQQQISGKTDAAVLHVANAPTRYHWPETDSGWTDAHFL